MDYDSSSEEEEAPPIYECALAELLAEGVAGLRASSRCSALSWSARSA